MEVRPVEQKEAESFLRLLCDVFGLDFARAHRIFFSEPMFDLQRKWALFEEGQIVSILTTVPLEFGWGKAIGIAGVATRPERRNAGLAELLLNSVLEASTKQGESGALLFAKQPTLYERVGFQVLDDVVRGRFSASKEDPNAEVLTFEEVQARYKRWAELDPARLRRDDRRWNYWKWNFRVCTAIGDGYLCNEGSTLRECVFTGNVDAWPIPIKDAEWFGLTGIAADLGIPLRNTAHELYFMGRGVPGVPRMFMTDQF